MAPADDLLENSPAERLAAAQRFYRGRAVMVTGGAGFIGSNLARRLVELDARVTIVDSLLPDYGGNAFNLDGIRDRVWLSVTDVRDANGMSYLVQDHEVIFNLAGQVSHEDSMRDPMTDLDINCRSQASLLEACRKHNRAVRLVLASTRQVYGRPRYLPVDEEHPLQPIDVNGINKLAGERYHLLYHRVHGMWTTVLRLTNTYGPRQLIRHARQGFIAWFVKQALEGGTIELFGDGLQRREMTYVTDVVDALLLAGANDCAAGEVFNLGGDVTTLKRLAELLCQLCPPTRYTTVPFPEERRRIDIGDYVADWQKAQRVLGWSPHVVTADGLRWMVEYYRTYGQHYA